MTRIRRSLVVLLTTLAGGAMAAELPAYYPSTFPRTGIVDRIDYAEQVAVINDTAYRIADRLIVHTPADKFASRFSLRKGNKIGFRHTDIGRGRRIVTEAWLLPASYGRSRE